MSRGTYSGVTRTTASPDPDFASGDTVSACAAGPHIGFANSIEVLFVEGFCHPDPVDRELRG